tara:strand:- start:385 stop:600 length:216 start_codon:yes stop_codon:yes gene_type:complete
VSITGGIVSAGLLHVVVGVCVGVCDGVVVVEGVFDGVNVLDGDTATTFLVTSRVDKLPTVSLAIILYMYSP